MLLNSLPFVCFIAAVLILYYLIPKKIQWEFLLVASCVFYALCNPMYLIYISVTSLTVWAVSLIVEKQAGIQKDYLAANKSTLSKEEKQIYKNRMKSRRFRLLILAVIFNIGILSVTKYTNFVINNINDLLNGAYVLKPAELLVPLGISFYTFKAVSYAIDVYRGKVQAERNFFKFALFVTYFPALTMGPISRYGDLAPSLLASHRYDHKNFSYGLMRILWGYFKKVVIADRVVQGLITLTGDEKYKGAYVFAAMLFYALQLYADFTGGIDITIGISEAMGIRMAENFNLPFFSKGIKEYWNRWHMTMGQWFTDYIFYPISVCTPMLKLSKWSRTHLPKVIGKRVTVYISCFTVWLATGIWHGASWNFVVWGLMNFAVLMISQELEPLYAKFHNRFHLKEKTAYGVFQVVRTILLMSALRMFDVYKDVGTTFRMMWTMISTPNAGVLFDGSMLNIGLKASDYAVLLVGTITLFAVSFIKLKKGSVRDQLYKKTSYVFYSVMAVMLIVILVYGAYGEGYNAVEFIYQKF